MTDRDNLILTGIMYDCLEEVAKGSVVLAGRRYLFDSNGEMRGLMDETHEVLYTDSRAVQLSGMNHAPRN